MTNSTLSLIIPVLNEVEVLPALVSRLNQVTQQLENVDVEFIFVDDGSTDKSFDLLKELSQRDDRVKVLKFSRNFGSHHACLAGLARASGERIIIMAADLQDPPELIPDLLVAAKSSVDVVWAIRKAREETKWVLFFAGLYHAFMKRFVFPTWPGEGADVVLMTRRVRDALLAWPEKNTSIFGQIFWLGFHHTTITYAKGKRFAGKSKWNFSKRLKLGLDSVVSFSFLPIRVISYSGIALSLVGFLYAIVVILFRLLNITQVSGWASLMIVLLLVSGLQLLVLGVIGEYLWRSADQVKSRPFYVVVDELGFGKSREPAMIHAKKTGMGLPRTYPAESRESDYNPGT
ncbi:MAG: glycosyltransferase family 2 protein [Candidatus Omnitrophica bacterium]|nr:glycosyltransferase family 2 protein [Candidatus Omnitrophota bacterium]